MKKMVLGIGILLFAILFQLCSSGLDLVSLNFGVVGLIFCVVGTMDKAEQQL